MSCREELFMMSVMSRSVHEGVAVIPWPLYNKALASSSPLYFIYYSQNHWQRFLHLFIVYVLAFVCIICSCIKKSKGHSVSWIWMHPVTMATAAGVNTLGGKMKAWCTADEVLFPLSGGLFRGSDVSPSGSHLIEYPRFHLFVIIYLSLSALGGLINLRYQYVIFRIGGLGEGGVSKGSSRSYRPNAGTNPGWVCQSTQGTVTYRSLTHVHLRAIW